MHSLHAQQVNEWINSAITGRDQTTLLECGIAYSSWC